MPEHIPEKAVPGNRDSFFISINQQKVTTTALL